MFEVDINRIGFNHHIILYSAGVLFKGVGHGRRLGARLVLLLRLSPGFLPRRFHVLVDKVNQHLVDQVLELLVSPLDLLAPDLAGLERLFLQGLM